MSPFTLPQTIDSLDLANWQTYQTYFEALLERPVQNGDAQHWLQDWSDLTCFAREAFAYLSIQRTLDTQDEARETIYLRFVEDVLPQIAKAEQSLKEKMLTLDIVQPEMALMVRDVRSEAELFSAENLPIATNLTKLGAAYDKVAASLAAEWDGETLNLNQLGVHLNSKDRAVRERAWHVMLGLWQDNRTQIDEIYLAMLPQRFELAKNASVADYCAYVFQEKKRFEYTPDDCNQFHAAIEQAVVPAITRILERKRQKMGVEQLRPWDWAPDLGMVVDTTGAPAFQPFTDQADLIARGLNVFDSVGDIFGRYFSTMADNDLLDLDTRAGKALGAYCYTYPLRKIPFIFMNATGSNRNVRTLLHEAGHAFHAFEAMNAQPWVWQQRAPMEFCEVASMSMELLAAPYLTHEHGGFYDAVQAAQQRIQHLENCLLFLPYMAVVDSFQQWVYTQPTPPSDAAQLDAKWDELWQRFLPDIDWTGYEAIRTSGWQRKLHIFRYPFYYIEYGMARIGSLQIWRNSITDHPQALADYRHALSLGGTKTLPELFEAAGAEFRFDVPMLTELTELVENTIAELQTVISTAPAFTG